MPMQGTFASRAVQSIVLAGLLIASVPASAQTYPTRPIRIVVPLPPGSNGDLMPRILGRHLATKLGQPVVIENRSGAAQNLGAEYVSAPSRTATPCSPRRRGRWSSARASCRTCRSIRRSSCRSPSWRSCRTSWWCIPTVPVATFAEFIAYAKANPGKLNYGTPGLGSSSHLTGEMLKLAAGIEMTHVPYGGPRPALTDLLAGHTDVMTANLDSVLAQVQEGKLRGLAVTSEKRAPEVPNLPAIAETYPEVVSTSWFAVVAPPKTPPRSPKSCRAPSPRSCASRRSRRNGARWR
jgi:tripartite-type tricarboxylate transporter receptor subunit TctC